jgi:hypothetical protein
LCFGVYELGRRRWLQPATVPPGRWALDELARLEALGLPSAGEPERYHTLLSDTVRKYLELRVDVRATRQTTAEFLGRLGTEGRLSAEHLTLVREFLECCDLAKFAPTRATPEESRAAATLAHRIIEQIEAIG